MGFFATLFQSKPAEIPRGEIIVRTRNSTYKIGSADKDGERTVARIGGSPLSFTRCRAKALTRGKSLELVKAGLGKEDVFRSSLVCSIT